MNNTKTKANKNVATDRPTLNGDRSSSSVK